MVKATPYACEVTNISGTIQFYLGESADDVTVIFDDGAFTNDLGALSAGKNSFALGVHTNYEIVVSKAGSGVFNQISVDTATNSFFGPRGVTVDRNPYSSFFGRIYVCNASAGTGNAPGRASGKGLYVLNADTSDALGYGNTAKVPTGMTLGSSSTYSPYKPFVGTDDVVYIGNADGTAVSTSPPGNAILWGCDPNLTSAMIVIRSNTPASGASMISTPFVEGSLAAGNLQVYCNLWGYNVPNPGLASAYTYIFDYPNILSSQLPYTGLPATNACISEFQGNAGVANVDGIIGDVYVAPDGKIFASNNRNASTGGYAAGAVSIWEYASDGVTYLWDSTQGGNYDPFAADGGGGGGIYGIAVSPDDKYLAAVDGATGDVLLCLLTNGVPDITTISTNVTGLGGTTRAVAFDAADNIYVASGGIDRLRVYSLGLNTTATTYNDYTGTNGSFSLVTPQVAFVSVVAITNQASQSGPTSGCFQITRSGGNTSLALTVRFSLGGTATNGTYTVSPSGIAPAATTNVLVLPPNVLSTNIYITPVNDGLSRPTTTVFLSLNPSANYVGAPGADTVYIQNIGPQVVFVSGVAIPSMYNVFSNDYCAFTVTRWGDTNAAAYPVNFNFSAGTAVEGTDFTGSNAAAPSLTINPGDVTDTVLLFPLINGQLPVDTNNLPYTGNKTIIASISSGLGYTASAGSATNTIIDKANPPATYLYLDPLSDPTDTNWDVRSVNDNMQTNAIDEYVDFGYDLYDDLRDPYVIAFGPGYVPMPFPPSGATNALRLTVNKSQPSGEGAAAAVNLYMTNAAFSGNYAVRFNMNLVEGNSGLYTTEGALFGIDHSGQATNWFTGSPIESPWTPGETEGWESDGIWCWVSVDDGVGTFAGGPSAYMVFTGIGGQLPNSGWANPIIAGVSAASEANNFKSSVFTSPPVAGAPGGPGLAANASPDATSPSEDTSWADVELKQFNNVVSIYIDKNLICRYVNTNTWQSGYLMLGYEDPYDSVGGGDAAVYYSNLRVVQLTAPLIGEIAPQSANYVFDFTSTDGDATPSSFTVVGATSINGPYTAVAGATITQLGNGAFQAVVPKSGATRFYRIQQSL